MGSTDWPATKRQAEAGPHIGWPYCAVGMQRALQSAIGLPSSSTNAAWMLGFFTPADVSSSFTGPPEIVCADGYRSLVVGQAGRRPMLSSGAAGLATAGLVTAGSAGPRQRRCPEMPPSATRWCGAA